MTHRRFTSTPLDPRRLSMPSHEIARQSVGERRRIHGPILPMARDRARRLDRATAAIGLVVAVILFALIILPGGAWLIAGAHTRPSLERSVSP